MYNMFRKVLFKSWEENVLIVAMHMDDRLVHGQVVMTWLPRVQANVVLVANNAVYNDKIRRSTMKLAVPSNTKIGFRTIAGAIQFLNNPQNSSYRVMVLTNNPLDAEKICKQVNGIEKITVGGIRKNAPMIRDNLNLTLEDIDSFKRIMSKGIKVGMQPTPNHKFEDLSDTFNCTRNKQ